MQAVAIQNYYADEIFVSNFNARHLHNMGVGVGGGGGRGAVAATFVLPCSWQQNRPHQGWKAGENCLNPSS